MSKLDIVKAEQDINYSCECPNCGETIYSEYQDDWDIHEMIHYDQTIKCIDCEHEFNVSY